MTTRFAFGSCSLPSLRLLPSAGLRPACYTGWRREAAPRRPTGSIAPVSAHDLAGRPYGPVLSELVGIKPPSATVRFRKAPRAVASPIRLILPFGAAPGIFKLFASHVFFGCSAPRTGASYVQQTFDISLQLFFVPATITQNDSARQPDLYPFCEILTGRERPEDLRAPPTDDSRLFPRRNPRRGCGLRQRGRDAADCIR